MLCPCGSMCLRLLERVAPRTRSASSRSLRIIGAASRVRSECSKRSTSDVDQLGGLARGLAPSLHVLVHDRLQVVDGEQVHVLEFGDLGLDVARHRDVHHEHRPALARAQRGRRHVARDDGVRARGRGDDDVGLAQVRRDLVERRSRNPGTRRPVRGRGRCCGSRRSCGAGRRHAGGARRARSSRPRRPAAPCGCRNSRTRSSPCATAAEATDTAFAPILVCVRTRFATENVAWNSRFSTGPVRARFLGDAIGVLQLPEDLRLAEHHGVESRTRPRTRARRPCARRGGTCNGGC